LTTNNHPDYSDITTIIFDMDGTLIEHTWQLDQITNALFARFANELSPVTHDEFYNVFWAKNEDMWYMMIDGIINGETAIKYSYVNTLRALGRDTSFAGPMVAFWQELVLTEALPFDDTFTVLDTLRSHYTTGILTNGTITLQRKKIEHHRLTDHVDFVLVPEEAGYHKPDKRLFLKALQLAGDPLPEQTLYIGDNPIADIQGAQSAGINPIFISGRNDMEPPADVPKIHQLSELLSLLKL
jgi:HAD superfamily hydrolase (TIGR01549 family)